MKRRIKPVGFAKPEVRGKGSFTPPPPSPLTPGSELGDYVIADDGTVGVLKSWQNNHREAVIQVSDGSMKTAEVC